MKKLLGYLLFSLTVLPIPSFGDSHEILIVESSGNQSLLFKPIFLKAAVGDSIIFKSELAGHATQSVFVPDGANTWRGNPDEKASFVLDKEGLYIYECRFHGNLGMAGIIQVGKARNLDDAKAFYYQYKKKFIVNKNRLDSIIENIQ